MRKKLTSLSPTAMVLSITACLASAFALALAFAAHGAASDLRRQIGAGPFDKEPSPSAEPMGRMPVSPAQVPPSRNARHAAPSLKEWIDLVLSRQIRVQLAGESAADIGLCYFDTERQRLVVHVPVHILGSQSDDDILGFLRERIDYFDGSRVGQSLRGRWPGFSVKSHAEIKWTIYRRKRGDVGTGLRPPGREIVMSLSMLGEFLAETENGKTSLNHDVLSRFRRETPLESADEQSRVAKGEVAGLAATVWYGRTARKLGFEVFITVTVNAVTVQATAMDERGRRLAREVLYGTEFRKSLLRTLAVYGFPGVRDQDVKVEIL